MSQKVEHGGLTFKKLYSKQTMSLQLDRLAKEMDNTFSTILAKQPTAQFLMLGVLNGAFMFTSEVVRRLSTRVFIHFVKVKSYHGMESGELTIETPLKKEDVQGKHVVILDDICDTGKTLSKLADHVGSMGASSVRVGVMVIRPDKVQELKPDFVGVPCSAFIIGFGLDLNGEARHYPDIYQKVE